MRLLPPDERGIRLAAAYLRGGRLVAFPTETVYGLGAVAVWSDAVARVFAAKGRPPDNPLIWHFPNAAEIARFAEPTRLAQAVLERHAPGPVTVVLRARRGGGTLACRVPGHHVALRLLAETGFPLAAPSANRSGRPSPTRAEHVLADLGDKVAAVLDGGPVPVGIESTVLDATGAKLVVLRPGAVTVEMLEAEGLPVARAVRGALLGRSPGTRHPHYRPTVPVAALTGVDEAGVARWVAAQTGTVAVVAPFSVPGTGPRRRYASAEELARSLYALLRDLEAACDVILVVGPERRGLGASVWDRLERAAAGRVYDGGATPKDLAGGGGRS